MTRAAAAGLAEVLPAGVTKLLNWRHNLGQGATVKLLDVESLRGANATATGKALQLAVDWATELSLDFGCLEVFEVAGGASSLRVLEVNSGLMMEFMARSLDGGYELARRVYRRAFELMFA